MQDLERVLSYRMLCVCVCVLVCMCVCVCVCFVCGWLSVWSVCGVMRPTFENPGYGFGNSSDMQSLRE